MGWFTWLFGKPLTPQQILRRNQRLVTKAVRNVEREIINMEKQEQKLVVEIKRMAQKSENDAVRTMASDLVRSRNHKKKLMKMKANLQGISLQLTTLESQQGITQAMYSATVVLRAMNRQLNMPRIQAILKEFEKQSQMMEIKEDMINETVDDAIGHEEESDESDDIVSQVLDELGLQLGEQLPEAPSSSKKVPKTLEAVADQSQNLIDDELLARLERLRKD